MRDSAISGTNLTLGQEVLEYNFLSGCYPRGHVQRFNQRCLEQSIQQTIAPISTKIFEKGTF